MKQICFLAILTLLFSGCKKETTHFLIGKWAIKEAWNDIGGGPVSNPTNSFIEFKPSGEFFMDTTSNLHAYKQYFQGLDRYSLRTDGTIKFFNSTGSDSTIAHYYLDGGLILSYGYISEKFIRKF